MPDSTSHQCTGDATDGAYGEVSQAAISKAVQRADLRCQDDAAWRRRLECLEKKLLAKKQNVDR